MALQAKAIVRGILADPTHQAPLKAHVAEALKADAARVVAAIAAATPVDTGALRGSLGSKVRTSPRGVSFTIEATATRAPTPGDLRLRPLPAPKKRRARKKIRVAAPRRYGPVPYGVFSENRTKFMSRAFEREHVSILKTMQAAVFDYVAQANTQFTVPSPQAGR